LTSQRIVGTRTLFAFSWTLASRRRLRRRRSLRRGGGGRRRLRTSKGLGLSVHRRRREREREREEVGVGGGGGEDGEGDEGQKGSTDPAGRHHLDCGQRNKQLAPRAMGEATAYECKDKVLTGIHFEGTLASDVCVAQGIWGGEGGVGIVIVDCHPFPPLVEMRQNRTI
jgi:hypothetical protein